jgi:hypothetical protein
MWAIARHAAMQIAPLRKGEGKVDLIEQFVGTPEVTSKWHI